MIKIAARNSPFSHRPGIACLLPGTHLRVKICPARLSFFRGSTLLFHLDVTCAGPVLDFTVQLDLEHSQIRVFSRTGFKRYVLRREGDAVFLNGEKLPCTLHEALVPPPSERLSLGMHKKQEWERVASRLDLKEIFPIWLHFGQATPPAPQSPLQGTLRLLQHCRELIREKRKTEVVSAFKNLFLAGFEALLIPRLFDTDYQGILPPEEGIENEIALPLLTQGAALIRSLFFQEEHGVLSLLPCLPPEFHAGRYLNLCTRAGDRLDIEWTKKEMRRVILHPVSQELHLQFPKHLKKCRVRSSRKERGRVHALKDGLLHIAGQHLVLIDCFQK